MINHTEPPPAAQSMAPTPVPGQSQGYFTPAAPSAQPTPAAPRSTPASWPHHPSVPFNQAAAPTAVPPVASAPATAPPPGFYTPTPTLAGPAAAASVPASVHATPLPYIKDYGRVQTEAAGRNGIPRGNCYRCGEPGHMAPVCPNRNKCRVCGGDGHWAKDCPHAV